MVQLVWLGLGWFGVGGLVLLCGLGWSGLLWLVLVGVGWLGVVGWADVFDVFGVCLCVCVVGVVGVLF